MARTVRAAPRRAAPRRPRSPPGSPAAARASLLRPRAPRPPAARKLQVPRAGEEGGPVGSPLRRPDWLQADLGAQAPQGPGLGVPTRVQGRRAGEAAEEHRSFPSQIPRLFALGRGLEAEGPRLPGPRPPSRQLGCPRSWAARGPGDNPGGVTSRGSPHPGCLKAGKSERIGQPARPLGLPRRLAAPTPRSGT